MRGVSRHGRHAGVDRKLKCRRILISYSQPKKVRLISHFKWKMNFE